MKFLLFVLALSFSFIASAETVPENPWEFLSTGVEPIEPNPDGLDYLRNEMAAERYNLEQKMSQEYSTGIAQSTAMAMATEVGREGLNLGLGAATYNGKSGGAIMFTNHTDKFSVRMGVGFSGKDDSPTLGIGGAIPIN